MKTTQHNAQNHIQVRCIPAAIVLSVVENHGNVPIGSS